MHDPASQDVLLNGWRNAAGLANGIDCAHKVLAATPRKCEIEADAQRSAEQCPFHIITGKRIAGEKPIDGITSARLVELAREAGHGDISHVSRREDLARWLDEHAKAGDLVITLGAGNIQLACNEVIELLEKRLGPATKKNLVRVAESSATVGR